MVSSYLPLPYTASASSGQRAEEPGAGEDNGNAADAEDAEDEDGDEDGDEDAGADASEADDGGEAHNSQGFAAGDVGGKLLVARPSQFLTTN